MKSKKAVSLSFETIIVIIIILIVFTVIVFFFTDAGSSLFSTLTDQANATVTSANFTLPK